MEGSHSALNRARRSSLVRVARGHVSWADRGQEPRAPSLPLLRDGAHRQGGWMAPLRSGGQSKWHHTPSGWSQPAHAVPRLGQDNAVRDRVQDSGAKVGVVCVRAAARRLGPVKF